MSTDKYKRHSRVICYGRSTSSSVNGYDYDQLWSPLRSSMTLTWWTLMCTYHQDQPISQMFATGGCRGSISRPVYNPHGFQGTFQHHAHYVGSVPEILRIYLPLFHFSILNVCKFWFSFFNQSSQHVGLKAFCSHWQTQKVNRWWFWSKWWCWSQWWWLS